MLVNKTRLQEELEDFSLIGRTREGGVDRPALSELEREANLLAASKLSASGCKIRFDAFGNLFATLEGSCAAQKSILVGSHLDTVPNGGKYDGALGVLAGLEIVRVLRENNITLNHSLEVVSFAAEEASRFGISMLGSSAATGVLSLQLLDKIKDAEGNTALAIAKNNNFSPTELSSCQLNPEKLLCYLELHIEQAKVLEKADLACGVVTAIANSTRLKVSLEGRADHSGTTPMIERADALLTASKIIQRVNQIAIKHGEGVAVATVGTLQVSPGSMSVIPGHVVLGIDIRDINGERKNRISSMINDAVHQLASSDGIRCNIEVLKDEQPVETSSFIVETIKKAGKNSDIATLEMPSGAGHDAMKMAAICPVGMIFVRSKDGLSHNSEEFSTAEDCALGTELMLQTILFLDQMSTDHK